MAQGISLNDFLFLNPELDSNCTNLYLNYSYCQFNPFSGGQNIMSSFNIYRCPASGQH